MKLDRVGRRNAKFGDGDIFGVAMPDGRFAIGQVLSATPIALGAVGCALFDEVVGPRTQIVSTNSTGRAIAVQVVIPDLIKRHIWPIIGNLPPLVPPSRRPYEAFRERNWIGAKVLGSGVIRVFMSAYHGLVPWDEFHDPGYLDTLLLPGVAIPGNVVRTRSNNRWRGP